MNARVHLLASVLFVLAPNVGATDIECNKQEKQKYEEIICNFGILNGQYENIYREQTQILNRAPDMRVAIEDWKKKRNACDDVPCMDSIFSEWKKVSTLIVETMTGRSGERPASQPTSPESTTQGNQSPPSPLGKQNEIKETPAAARGLPALTPPIVGIQEDQLPFFLDLLITAFLFVAVICLWAWSNRCPRCGKWLADRVVSKDFLYSVKGKKTVTRHDKHRNRHGVLTSTTERKAQVGTITNTYDVNHECKQCHYEWQTRLQEKS